MSSITDFELDCMREDQEAEMDDQCIIDYISDRGALNEATSEYDNPTWTTVYTGKCSVFPIVARRDRMDSRGEHFLLQRQYRIHLPWDSGDIAPKMRFRATTTQDPQLLNRDLEVRDVYLVSQPSQRRIVVHDIVG
jgi:hypothetical protein